MEKRRAFSRPTFWDMASTAHILVPFKNRDLPGDKQFMGDKGNEGFHTEDGKGNDEINYQGNEGKALWIT